MPVKPPKRVSIDTILFAIKYVLEVKFRGHEFDVEAVHQAQTYSTSIHIMVPLKNGSKHTLTIHSYQDIDVGNFGHVQITDELVTQIMLLLG